jgi:hypothetical protein
MALLHDPVPACARLYGRGMGVNPVVLRLLADRLAQPETTGSLTEADRPVCR